MPTGLPLGIFGIWRFLLRDDVDAFAPEFFRDESKLQQWSAVVRDLSSQISPFETVIAELAKLTAPVTAEDRAQLKKEGHR
jgi:hypothetical protein